MARMIFRLAPVAATLLMGACAGDSMPNLFQTASVAPPAEQVAAAMPRIDPTCVTLANQIEGLRKEGTIERLEKVAAGKGDSVQVKRAALAKQAELNKANADFQAKCGPRLPQQASATPAVVDATAGTAAKVAAKATSVASGVTAVPSTPAVPKAP